MGFQTIRCILNVIFSYFTFFPLLCSRLLQRRLWNGWQVYKTFVIAVLNVRWQIRFYIFHLKKDYASFFFTDLWYIAWLVKTYPIQKRISITVYIKTYKHNRPYRCTNFEHAPLFFILNGIRLFKMF